MKQPGSDTLADSFAAPAVSGLASRWRWVGFEPPLRDPRTMKAAVFHVFCKVCGSELGRAQDPVEALRLAWRSRRHPKHHATGLVARSS